MVLRLYPQPSLFDEDVTLIRDATPVPVSSFYLRRPYFVPWSALPSVFILETDEPDQPHEIIINRTDRTSFVPGQNFSTLQLQLAKGANRIEVSTPNQSIYITVASTAVETWLRTLGREYYLSVGRRLSDIRAHFITPWTTRASAYLLPFTELFLPARMPKIQQTRMAVLTSMGGRLGSGDGVRTMASAVSYSTPPVGSLYAAEFAIPGADFLYPHVTTHPTTGEVQGRLFDLWYANTCLAARQALFQFSLALGGEDVPSPVPIRLVSVDDRQLLLRYMEGPTEAHYIDPSSPECSDIEFNTACDAATRAFLQFETRLDIVMNTPQLPFDEVVETPLNFGFWDEGAALDASEGSGESGLGGGDDVHDTVDPYDPWGTGFQFLSLSRRLDNPGCLDTRMQRGQRMVKFTFPISSSSPPALTPTPGTMAEGIVVRIDGASGAPPPTIGATVVWGSCARTFLYENDSIRFEDPDAEYSVVSAWPVFDAAKIIKSDSTGTYTPSGTQKIITAPTGFFEPRHEGMGLRVNGSLLYCIVKTSDDGVASYATLAGNPTAPPGGPLILNVYEPLRDRSDASEPAASTLQDFAGSRTYEITLSSGLIANLTDGVLTSYRDVPRASGALTMGSTVFTIASDVKPLPSDRLYYTSSVFGHIVSATATGQVHHTTGWKIYTIEVEDPAPMGFADNAPLYVVRADPCWDNGDPVTPLMLISLEPPGYMEP